MPRARWKRRSTRRSSTTFRWGRDAPPCRGGWWRAARTAGSKSCATSASLRAPDLRRWRIGRNALIAAPPRLYPETARWAAAIHDRFPDVDGLVWTSNRCDPDSAYLFFGDRAGAEDFRVAEARDGRRDTTFLADVREAGGRCGVVIAV